MKKLYALSLILLSSFAFAQSVVITKVVDGSLPQDGCSGTTGSSSPKFVELYVSGTADLSFYRIQTEANGAADAASINWSNGLQLNALGTVSNSFVYVVYNTGSTTFTEMFSTIPSAKVLIDGNAPNMNGNDAIRVSLYDTAQPATGTTPAGNMVSVIDQFGDPLQVTGTNDFAAPWAYADSYATRNNGIGANAGSFATASFSYGGNDLFDAPNNTCSFISTAVAIGTYNAPASTKNFDTISGLKLFPNPLSGNVLNVTSNSNADKTIAVYDVLGKNVLNAKVTNETVNVSALNSGVYILKITEEGKTATRKLVVK